MLRTCHSTRLCCPLIALVGALLFAAGCWTEVPYEAPAEPAEEPRVESEESRDTTPPTEANPAQSDTSPAASIPESVEPDRYATQEPSTDELLPWETDSASADPSPEAERLFGEASEPIEDEPPSETDIAKEKTDDDDSFESFLTEAYADLNDTPADSPEQVAPHEPSTPEPILEENVADLPVPEPTPEPVEETPVEETESFESLFSSEPEPTEGEIETPEPRYAEEPEPLPLAPKPPVATKHAPAEVWPKIEPLPAVPVLSFNTRHMAWLLGGKLSLAQLAGAGGATPSEVAGWTDETERLAEQLKVAAPPGADPDAPATERVGRLLSSAAAISAQIAQEYGTDHAALVEMALKSNALLVLHEKRPDLTPAVARAIAAAANRAELPGYLWRDALKTLERRPTTDEVFDAVTKLHADVEAYLR